MIKQDLNSLSDRILEDLKAQGLAVFQGFLGHTHGATEAYWDAHRHPEHGGYLAIARQVGAKIVVMSQMEFQEAMAEEALADLEECDLSAREKRSLQKRLRDMRAYMGFTCAVKLSFDHDGRAYIYEVRADWYTEFLGILAQLDHSLEDDDYDDENGCGEDYLSRN
jgi:hypothetical protein